MDKKELQGYLNNENVQFFLYSILKYESGKINGKVNIGGHNETSGNSSAFGSQQFIGDTRNEILQKYGVDAWSQDLEEQQLATLALLHRRKQLENAAAGDYSNIKDWEAFNEENRTRLDNRPENWLEQYNSFKSDSVYDPSSSWAKIPEEMKKQKKEIFDRKYSDVDFVSITTETDTPVLENPPVINEEKKLTTLQQSVIDNLYLKIDEQEGLGLDNKEDILKKNLENYILSLDENDLINANNLSLDDIKDLSKEPEDYSIQKERIDSILNNKSEYSIDVVNNARLARQNIARYTNDDSIPISKDNVDKSLFFLDELEELLEKELPQKELPQKGEMSGGYPTLKAKTPTAIQTSVATELIKTEQQVPLENITKQRKGLKNVLSSVKNSADEAFFALSAGAGIMSVYEATRRDKVTKSHIDPLFKEALLKTREASQIGMPYEQRQAALKDIANSYSGAMKNVMAISGGQRGAALANIGAVDSSRVNALVDLASKSADLRQKNLDLYSKTAAAYSNQKLNADMNNETLRQKVEMNRKNNLRAIGLNLFKEATEFSRNYMDISGIEGSGNQTSIIPGNNVNNEVVNEELSDNIGV